MIWIYIWTALAIGFVLGAAWAGLGVKNKQVNKMMEKKFTENVNPSCAICSGGLSATESLCDPCLQKELAKPLEYP